MLILAIDTALDACQAAVLDGPRLLAHRSEPMSRGHQERLAPLVRDVVAEAGVRFPAFERLAVTVGPGSFTGLRVGLAFAKGVALALQRPCVGVGTLEALAARRSTPGLTAAVIDARRERVYLQLFRHGAPANAPELLDIEAAIALLRSQGPPAALVGPGAPLLAPAFPQAAADARAWPDIAAVARLGLARTEPIARPAPLYLRSADARTLAERALG